jgi:hypothetical protein
MNIMSDEVVSGNEIKRLFAVGLELEAIRVAAFQLFALERKCRSSIFHQESDQRSQMLRWIAIQREDIRLDELLRSADALDDLSRTTLLLEKRSNAPKTTAVGQALIQPLMTRVKPQLNDENILEEERRLDIKIARQRQMVDSTRSMFNRSLSTRSVDLPSSVAPVRVAPVLDAAEVHPHRTPPMAPSLPNYLSPSRDAREESMAATKSRLTALVSF